MASYKSCIIFLPLTGGLVLTVLPFSRPSWRDYRVDGARAVKLNFDFTDREHLNHSRNQGLFKICFQGVALLSDSTIISEGGWRERSRRGHYYRFGPTHQCASVNWDFSLVRTSAEKEQLKLRWASYLLYLMACSVCSGSVVVAALALFIKQLRFAVATVVLLLCTVVLTATSILNLDECFRIAENDLWPKSVSLFTTVSYSSAYFAAWAGVGFLLLSAVEMAIYARILAKAEKKYRARREEITSGAQQAARPPAAREQALPSAPPLCEYTAPKRDIEASLLQSDYVNSVLSKGGLTERSIDDTSFRLTLGMFNPKKSKAGHS